MMKKNDKLFGFTVKSVKQVDEIAATVYELVFDKNGARLVYFDRDDENMTFSIAFKTLPKDSTGVFHILEHSVLCGSEKYPAKDPFVELLKGSLNTFLNAMTYQDKTVYPVASRNKKDFMNLVSVYLDAVFCPLAARSEFAFMQEGWHYEYDAGELSYKGVVYNEMKGAYSSADNTVDTEIFDMLFDRGPYRHDSGGDPCEIIKLSYADFKAAHATYYHPSNATLFLDGAIDIGEVMPLISEYLSRYERRDVSGSEYTIEKALPRVMRREGTYEVREGENGEDKDRLAIGYLIGGFDEQEKNSALSVLASAICSTNDTPLRRAILDSGLCEDVGIVINDGCFQPSMIVDFKNVKSGRADELCDLYYDTVAKLCDKGIDKKLIDAALSSIEFRVRESDYGSYPRGVAYATSMLDTYLYSDDATSPFEYERLFKLLRDNMQTDYYENILKSILIDNPSRATLLLHPSQTLAAERAEREREELRAALADMGDRGVAEVCRRAEALCAYQEAEESEDVIAALPRLTLEDIPKTVTAIPTSAWELDGVKIVNHDISTSGIIYLDLYFDVSDITPCEVFALSNMTNLSGNLPTAAYSLGELEHHLKCDIGVLSISFYKLLCKEGTRLYIKVSGSVLESKAELIIPLLREVVLKTRFDDKEEIRRLLRQLQISTEESYRTSGHSLALQRAEAMVSAGGAAKEYYLGYESYRMLTSLLDNFDSEFESIGRSVAGLRKKYLTASRLLVSVTGKADNQFLQRIIDIFEKGEKKTIPVSDFPLLKAEKTAFIVPARVGYAVRLSNLSLLDFEPTGALSVVRNLLSYEYLWGTIRVQGGAYGTGFITNIFDNIGFYSYRDPTPDRSLTEYSGSGDFLREFARGGGDITKFIIGAVGDSDQLLSPSVRGLIGTRRYLLSKTQDELDRFRNQQISTSAEELLRIAELCDRVNREGVICVVGGKDKISRFGEYFDKVITV